MASVATSIMELGEVLANTTFKEDTFTPIISNTVMFYIQIYMNFIVAGSFSLFGMVNNILNMIVFHKLGLKDSMSIGLMALSLTDFLVCLLTELRVSYFIWKMVSPDGEIDPMAISGMTVGYWRDILFLCSSWVTTFLSVERCVCVVFPFKVKDIFTKFRSIVILAVIYIVNIALHMPIIVTQWLEWTTVEMVANNKTFLKRRLVIQFSENRRQMQLYIDIANGTVLPIPSQVLVVISVIWMIYGLRASSRIRKTISTSGQEKTNGQKENNLSVKERRLVKVVLFLAIILTFCNVPRFLAVYAKQIFPTVAFRGSDENLFMLLWSLPILASSINSSINIVIYLVINKSYRQKFNEVFLKKKK